MREQRQTVPRQVAKQYFETQTENFTVTIPETTYTTEYQTMERMVPEVTTVQVPQTTTEMVATQVPRMIPQETVQMVPQTTTEMVATQVPRTVVQEVQTISQPIVTQEVVGTYEVPTQQTYAAPMTTMPTM